MNTYQNQVPQNNFKIDRPKTNPFKVLSIMLLSIMTLFIVVYAGVALYFTDRFMPNTSAAGMNLSLMTSSEAEDYIKDKLDDYTLTLMGEGFELELSSTDAGLTINTSEAVDSMLDEVNPWLWPFEISETHDESDKLITGSSGTILLDTITEAVETFNSSAKAPTDASITYDSSENQLVITPDSIGTALDAEAIAEVAEEAIESLSNYASITTDQLLQPSVTADDERLTSAVSAANAMASAEVTLTMDGYTIAELDSETIFNWITLDDDMNATLDASNISDWVDSVAADTDTVGGTRTYERSDGKEVTVTGGVYGWEIDTEELLEEVEQAVDGGLTVTIEVPTITAGGTYDGSGERDWGTAYLDIDLTEQYARLYDDNGDIIWESDIISGSTLTDSETPTGVYWMNQTSSPSTLMGYSNGELVYETEVEYWMPFIGNSIGLHDASWQTSGFGGTLYQEGYGSHGCINLPTDAAAELYSLIGGGDIVVCHY